MFLLLHFLQLNVMLCFPVNRNRVIYSIISLLSWFLFYSFVSCLVMSFLQCLMAFLLWCAMKEWKPLPLQLFFIFIFFHLSSLILVNLALQTIYHNYLSLFFSSMMRPKRELLSSGTHSFHSVPVEEDDPIGQIARPNIFKKSSYGSPGFTHTIWLEDIPFETQ